VTGQDGLFGLDETEVRLRQRPAPGPVKLAGQGAMFTDELGPDLTPEVKPERTADPAGYSPGLFAPLPPPPGPGEPTPAQIEGQGTLES
jgi:hypothetical protein